MSSVAPADLPVGKDLGGTLEDVEQTTYGSRRPRASRSDSPRAPRRSRRSSSRCSGRSRPSGCFISSFRPAELIRTTGWWTIFANPGFTLENYGDVLFSSSSSSPQLGSYIVNSIAIALLATIIPLVFASMAAYAFAWMQVQAA